MIVLTRIDYSKKNTPYGKAKKSLHKFKGEQVTSSSTDKSFQLHATYLAENEMFCQL